MSEKIVSQRGRILALLRERGTAGVTNIELNAIAFRYGGRLFELRKLGFRIRTIRTSDSVFRFVLEGEPVLPPVSATSASPHCALPLFDSAVTP